MERVAEVASFALGFNHDPRLIDAIDQLNRLGAESGTRITEVFGAISSSPLPSARPARLLPVLEPDAFSGHVRSLSRIGVQYNYLFNAVGTRSSATLRLSEFVEFLREAGVARVTVNARWLIEFFRSRFPEFHVTMSITYGVQDLETLRAVRAAGADAVYVQPVTVNRNFRVLREMLDDGGVDLRLYANVSCISGCPIVQQHYGAFRLPGEEAERLNNAMFAACSQVKLVHPIEWMQMPWIRPEDILRYQHFGLNHFKLSDRLASTECLLRIAKAYMFRRSPKNLFTIIERDMRKYNSLLKAVEDEAASEGIMVDSDCIDESFVSHFIDGVCSSNDRDCSICRSFADRAIRVPEELKVIAEKGGWVNEFPEMRGRMYKIDK